MKIALMFDDLTINGGGQRQLLHLAQEFVSAGHSVTVFAFEYNRSTCYPDLCRDLDIRAVRTLDGIPQKSSANWVMRTAERAREYYVAPRLMADLITERFDVLHPHERPVHYAAVQAKKKWGSPIVWMFNDPGSWELNYYENSAMPISLQKLKPYLFRSRERKVVRQIDAVAVLSHGVQAIFHREFGVYPQVVRTGLDKDYLLKHGDAKRMRAKLGVSRETLLVLFLAVLSPSRRVEDAVEAIASVRASGRDVKFVVAGSSRNAPGYLDVLQQKAAQLGIADSVMFLSSGVSEEDRRDLYHACDVFVWPNEAQSWGLAPLEAMVCGKPAIVSLGAGVHEVLRDGETALLVPPRQPAALARAVAFLCDTPEARLRIGKRGAEFIQNQFSWADEASHLEKLFEDVIRSRNLALGPKEVHAVGTYC